MSNSSLVSGLSEGRSTFWPRVLLGYPVFKGTFVVVSLGQAHLFALVSAFFFVLQLSA